MYDRKRFGIPTPEEMRALNVAAQRARARQMKLLFLKGARAVKRCIAHVAASSVPKKLSHA
jgi:hypothetical protein